MFTEFVLWLVLSLKVMLDLPKVFILELCQNDIFMCHCRLCDVYPTVSDWER